MSTTRNVVVKDDAQLLALCNRLVRLVIRAFYDDLTVLVVDTIIREARMITCTQLAAMLQLKEMPINKRLQQLSSHGLAQRQALSYKHHATNSKRQNDFWYIDYKRFIDVVKWRVYCITKSSEQKELASTGSFVCPQCHKVYSLIEAGALINMSTGAMECQRCHTEVEEESPTQMHDGKVDTSKARLLRQLAPIVDVLKDTEGQTLPPIEWAMSEFGGEVVGDEDEAAGKRYLGMHDHFHIVVKLVPSDDPIEQEKETLEKLPWHRDPTDPGYFNSTTSASNVATTNTTSLASRSDQKQRVDFDTQRAEAIAASEADRERIAQEQKVRLEKEEEQEFMRSQYALFIENPVKWIAENGGTPVFEELEEVPLEPSDNEAEDLPLKTARGRKKKVVQRMDEATKRRHEQLRAEDRRRREKRRVWKKEFIAMMRAKQREELEKNQIFVEEFRRQHAFVASNPFSVR